MHLQYVMVPNPKSRALGAIDGLSACGLLADRSADVLKALYVRGWDDGFVANAKTIGDLLHLTPRALRTTLDDLARSGTIAVRDRPDGGAVVELCALAKPWDFGDVALGWWRIVLVDDDPERG